MENVMLCGTLQKIVSAFWFSGKIAFLESVSFHSQILGATNFGLVVDDCIIFAIIFIKKYIVSWGEILFSSSFLFKSSIIILN